MFRRPRVVIATVAAAAIAAVSIGATTAGAQDGGSVNVSGSSTVEPITSLVAELYAEKNPDVQVRVDGPGTGDGFKLFCNGETDISDASRAIKPEEASACQAKGITYTELPVGIDGLTIAANKSSKLKCLDQEQIYAIFGPESTGSLADAQTLAAELGSTNKALPSGSVKKFTPGPESGTYDSFIELNYQKIMDERQEAGEVETITDEEGEEVVKEPVKSDGQFPNDNAIVKRIEGSKSGIGFFGFAFFEENAEDLKAISVKDPETGKCVKPTRKTIQNGSYPVSRTLFIYPNNAEAASNPSVQEFVDLFMTTKSLTKTVAEAGYIALPKADQTESIDTWKAVG